MGVAVAVAGTDPLEERVAGVLELHHEPVEPRKAVEKEV